jgi:hypothetical protein
MYICLKLRNSLTRFVFTKGKKGEAIMKKGLMLFLVFTFSIVGHGQSFANPNSQQVTVLYAYYESNRNQSLQTVYSNMPIVQVDNPFSYADPLRDSIQYRRQIEYIKPGIGQSRAMVRFKNNTQKKVTSKESNLNRIQFYHLQEKRRKGIKAVFFS